MVDPEKVKKATEWAAANDPSHGFHDVPGVGLVHFNDGSEPNFDDYDEEQVECWQCDGEGRIAGCHVDLCDCGMEEDPHESCASRRCDICDGNGSYPVEPSVSGTGEPK